MKTKIEELEVGDKVTFEFAYSYSKGVVIGIDPEGFPLVAHGFGMVTNLKGRNWAHIGQTWRKSLKDFLSQIGTDQS